MKATGKTLIRWHQRERPHRTLDRIGKWSVRIAAAGSLMAFSMALIVNFQLVVIALGVIGLLTIVGVGSLST